jgi:DNA polymerase-3 subunit epsilon
VKDKLFDEVKHKNSWIFNNSSLKLEDVLNAKPLDSYRAEIQGLLDKYPITAFNMKFDTGFMSSHNFRFKETKCLMESSKPYNKNKGKYGEPKVPSVPEIYAQFFPEENYNEEHRGSDDAYHEGKILLKLVELKSQKQNVTTNTKKNN